MGLKQQIQKYLPNFGLSSTSKSVSARRTGSVIAPYQFTRIKQDVQLWRDAITEAELAWYPHRVKMQRIFMDTILNGHVLACLNKRKNLTLLKKYAIYNGDKVDERATELLQAEWFHNLLNYSLEAEFFGYSLIELGDLVDNKFPNLTIVKRENVSPDRLNITSLVYSISGVDFMNPEETDEEGNSFYDWSLYVSTPSDKGQSICGYGLLYNIALYEILLRNVLAYNSDYVEVYGQPVKWAKSPKLEGAEYDTLEQSLKQMASNPYIITGMQEELEFINGTDDAGYMSYDNFEQRLEKKITKLVLGHEDAISQTAGQLGANQGKESAVYQALEDVENIDTRFLEHVVNEFLEKAIVLGLPIPVGAKFKFSNDKEVEEIKLRKTEANTKIAAYVLSLKNAGYSVDETQLAEMTGLKLTKEAIAPPTNVATKLKNLYDNA